MSASAAAARPTSTARRHFKRAPSCAKSSTRRRRKLLGCAEDQVVYKSGKFSAKGGKAKPLTLSDVVKANEGPVTVSVETEVPRKGSSTSFIAQVAEVEVDRETGRVKLNKFVTAHDVGTIINPLGHQGQIDGEAIMAIGSSLMEELIDDQGKITTTNLGEYKIPNILDIPKLKTVLVQRQKRPRPVRSQGHRRARQRDAAGGDRQRRARCLRRAAI